MFTNNITASRTEQNREPKFVRPTIYLANGIALDSDSPSRPRKPKRAKGESLYRKRMLHAACGAGEYLIALGLFALTVLVFQGLAIPVVYSSFLMLGYVLRQIRSKPA